MSSRAVRRLLAYLLCLGLLATGLPVTQAAPLPLPPQIAPDSWQSLASQATATAAQTVVIGGNGFDKTALSVFGPTDIAWENRSGVTVTLRSGVRTNPGSTLYLPTLSRSDGSRAQVISRVRNDTVDFAVTLGPGDRFIQRYTAPGSYDFHLAAPPQAGSRNLTGKLTLSGTGLLGSSPENGEDGVAVTRETILTFSAALNPATVTKSVFSASSAGKALDFRLHLSKDARQVTLFYSNPLPGGAAVQVKVDGASLRDAVGGLVDVDGDNAPGGTTALTFSTLSLAMIPGTSVCGRVFASQLATSGNTSVNEPLQGATITVDGQEQTLRTTTDNNGNFCLDPSPAGRFFVHIDGRTATNGVPAGSYYPFVGKAWESVAGVQSSVGDVYLPLVEPGTLQPVSQTEDVTIHFAPSVLNAFPDFANVSITVPAGSLFNDDGTPGGQVGIAPVPPDRLPGQLPEALQFPLVITVQTDGAGNFDVPAPVCFPNLPNPATGKALIPGEKSALWSFNHDTGRFGVVGPMTANEDASLVCTDPGVGVPAPGWHSWNPGVPTNNGPARPNPPPPPPPPPADEDPKCEPGKVECKPKENYQPKPNGCGPQPLIDLTSDLTIYNNPVLVFWPVNALVGTGCDFRPSCNTHDVGYGQCNSNKPDVDTTFLRDMRLACDACYSDFNKPGRLACYTAAQTLYDAVANLGNRFYKEAQQKACECEECPGGAGRTGLPSWMRYAEPLEGASADNDQLLAGLIYYLVVNLDTGLEQRGVGGSNGIVFERDIILQPQSRYRIFLLHAQTLYEDYMDVVTPASGERLELPPFYLYEQLGYDLDGDGLMALGEEIMGTDPAIADSDGDGVVDGAEVTAGDDPLSGVLVKTGIIGSAETPGNAQDICISGEVAAVADGDAGVAIFNVFAGMNPQLVAQVDTPGSAGGVACSGSTLAVAGGAAGLAIVDARNPTAAAITRQVAFGGVAVYSVAAANGKAYAGLADGRVVRVDMSTGAVEKSVQLVPTENFAPEIQDVILLGDFLHAISEGGIFAAFLADLTPMGTLLLNTSFEGLEPRRRLAGGDGLLLAAQDQTGDIFRLDVPINLQKQGEVNDTIFGWRHIVPNGTGLVVASTAPAPDSPADQHRVGVYNLTDPRNPSFVVEYETPGMPRALTINAGLVYMADGDAGVQVLNFQAADTVGITPTVTLDSNLSPGRFQPGGEMRLTALAQDDKQIRSVEFYLNGDLIQRDSSYPFEIRATAPTTAVITLRAKATDTGGKFAWTEIQTRTQAADAIVPEVLTISPGWEERVNQEGLTIRATFSEPMNQATLTPGSFQLLDASAVAVGNGAVIYEPISRTATLRFDPPPAPGDYNVVLNSTVTDSAGNPLPRRSWPITVLEALNGSFFTFSDDPGTFLSAIDIDGDWLVVGASNAQIGDNISQGAAYLFTKDASTPSGWREVKKLTGSDGAAGDEFGRAVTVSGDTVVVGAPAKRVVSNRQGQVYVFARNQGGPDNWGEVTRFADAVGSSRFFGSEVEAVGNTFVVIPTTVLKTAYIYRRSTAGATDWALIKEVALDDSFGQNFGAGEAIALSADEKTLIASVPRLSHDENSLNEGVVRIFEQDAGGVNNWGQTGQLQASDAARNAYFGGDVALYGEILVVGSPFYDTSQELNATGRFYIFRKDAGNAQGWREVGVFSEPDTLTSVRTLGESVGAAPGLVIATGESKVYIYQPVNGNLEQWQRTVLWAAENEPAAGFFNGIVAVDGTSVATTASLTETGVPAVFLLQVVR